MHKVNESKGSLNLPASMYSAVVELAGKRKPSSFIDWQAIKETYHDVTGNPSLQWDLCLGSERSWVFLSDIVVGVFPMLNFSQGNL